MICFECPSLYCNPITFLACLISDGGFAITIGGDFSDDFLVRFYFRNC